MRKLVLFYETFLILLPVLAAIIIIYCMKPQPPIKVLKMSEDILRRPSSIEHMYMQEGTQRSIIIDKHANDYYEEYDDQ